MYRATLVLLWLIIIVLASSVLVLRYVALPNIDHYKDQIATHASKVAGQKITIGDIDARWDGLNPHLSLFNVQLYDPQQRPALTLEHIETSLSWLSIPLLEPRLSSISIYKPELTIRREADGTVYVAGISMAGPARPEFPNWLLRQSQIDVIDASILWQDELRQAPPLSLNNLRLQIVSPAWESIIGHHRFGLQATPSAGSSQPIDIRGNLYGKDITKPSQWRGTLYGRLEGTDIAAWRNWISYPFKLRDGYGAAQFWLVFDDGKPKSITSDVVLSNVKTQLSSNSPEASLDQLSGRLKWRQYDDGQEISGERITLRTSDGLNMQKGKIRIRERDNAGKQTTEGEIALDELRLESITNFAANLPLPQALLSRLNELAPVGMLHSLELRWKGGQGFPDKYTIRSQFSGLGMQPYEVIPGFSNLSGSIDANEKIGTATISSRQAQLNFDKIMRWPIPVDTLTGQVNWRKSGDKAEIRVSNLTLSNPHLAGTINASFNQNGVKGGYLDLNAKFGNADAKFAHYYFPKVMGEHTLHWLDTAILAGHGEDINVTVKGHLHDFPYANNKLGLFRVTAKITDAELDYSPGWPKLEGIKLNMLFEGNRMELNASNAYALGNQVTKAKISIPALDSHQPVLDVTGEAQGLVVDGIKFVNNSPLFKLTKGFTDTLRTSGNGKLNLDLHIPLHDAEASKVKAAYQISNGSLQIDGAPELSMLNGKLEFTESSLKAQAVNAYVYGGPAQINVATGKDHVIRVTARGRITDSGLKQAFGPGPADRLTGSTDWLSSINVFNGQADVSVSSNLIGMASTLPAPMAKSAGEPMMLKFEKKQQGITQDMINFSVGNLLSAKVLRSNQNGVMKPERGEIGLNVAAELPGQSGLAVRGSLDQLDLDEWRNIFEKSSSGNTNLGIGKVDLSVNVLDIFDRRINNLKLQAKPVGDSWQMNILSREINGDATWHSQGKGKISAKLKSLLVPAASPGTAELRTQGDFKQQAQAYPALDIVADSFEVGKKKLGRLELQASEQDDDWSIEKLKIITPESTLTGEGEWHNWKRNPNTRINFSWDINDIGKTLERFGYPNTIKGGEADLSGQLKWPGSPHEFDYPGLSGNLQLDAHKGQILKIQPGVGRLFSVLSLQNLPRRLTFDFRDVFSSGFTFDKINSSVKIDRGIMRSDDFKMEGPTARIEIKGETDLQKETQHLYVSVTPYISDSLSIAALAGGPVAGAAAYIAQKLLKDPINKLAADEYEIVGTWDKPVEVKNNDSKPANDSPTAKPLGK